MTLHGSWRPKQRAILASVLAATAQLQVACAPQWSVTAALEFECPLLSPRAVAAGRMGVAADYSGRLEGLSSDFLRVVTLWLAGRPGESVTECRFLRQAGESVGGGSPRADGVLIAAFSKHGERRRVSLSIRDLLRDIRREQARLDEQNTEEMRSPPYLRGKAYLRSAMTSIEDGDRERATRAAEQAAKQLAGRFYSRQRWVEPDVIEVDLAGLESGPTSARLWIPGVQGGNQ